MNGHNVDLQAIFQTFYYHFQDKWDGEDEDDDVKAAWDASSEEEDSKSSENSVKAVQVKKKKKLHEIIAEKEAKKALEEEEAAAAKAEKEAANTPEGKLAQKLRAQKIAEAQDLQMARELMGGGGPPGSIGMLLFCFKFPHQMKEKLVEFVIFSLRKLRPHKGDIRLRIVPFKKIHSFIIFTYVKWQTLKVLS